MKVKDAIAHLKELDPEDEILVDWVNREVFSFHVVVDDEVTHAEIFCDGMDGICPEVFSAPHLDLKSFFKEFRLEGWRKKNGFRYCPNCVERENIKVFI